MLIFISPSCYNVHGRFQKLPRLLLKTVYEQSFFLNQGTSIYFSLKGTCGRNIYICPKSSRDSMICTELVEKGMFPADHWSRTWVRVTCFATWHKNTQGTTSQTISVSNFVEKTKSVPGTGKDSCLKLWSHDHSVSQICQWSLQAVPCVSLWLHLFQ